MEDDKKVLESEEQTISETTNNILKPSIPSEELISKTPDQRKKELTVKVERYNYNQGLRKTSNGPSIILKETKKQDPVSTEKVTIKAPGRKNNKVLIIVLVLVVALIGGFTIYSNSLKQTSTPPPIVEQPTEEEPPQVEDKTITNVCKNSQENTFAGFTTVNEYQIISIDNKLQKTINYRTLEFNTTPPEVYTNACINYQSFYKGYDGYINTCLIEQNNIIYKTVIDFNVLKEKELKFTINNQETTIKIGDNLDDDINPIIEKYTNSGYTCDNS